MLTPTAFILRVISKDTFTGRPMPSKESRYHYSPSIARLMQLFWNASVIYCLLQNSHSLLANARGPRILGQGADRARLAAPRGNFSIHSIQVLRKRLMPL
jgi:hypothetical protein